MSARTAIHGALPPSAPLGGALLLDGPGRSPNELLAGLTLVALAAPMNIGYASVAGLPATVGIYASIVPLLVFAVTTGSRRLVVGPDAATAALLTAALGPVVATGVTATETAPAVVLLAGPLLSLGWLIGLGDLVRFLSHAAPIGCQPAGRRGDHRPGPPPLATWLGLLPAALAITGGMLCAGGSRSAPSSSSGSS